ncbi:hypothetical protein M426DRAFT_23735 [Hypoxylon sp. CI-4A]|nr:hypothetical protein M426DRAFT_23735 [Hypoxylon sp. CI-4A]
MLDSLSASSPDGSESDIEGFVPDITVGDSQDGAQDHADDDYTDDDHAGTSSAAPSTATGGWRCSRRYQQWQRRTALYCWTLHRPAHPMDMKSPTWRTTSPTPLSVAVRTAHKTTPMMTTPTHLLPLPPLPLVGGVAHAAANNNGNVGAGDGPLQCPHCDLSRPSRWRRRHGAEPQEQQQAKWLSRRWNRPAHVSNYRTIARAAREHRRPRRSEEHTGVRLMNERQMILISKVSWTRCIGSNSTGPLPTTRPNTLGRNPAIRRYVQARRRAFVRQERAGY